MRESISPQMVVWELTATCNLRCNYCYVGRGHHPQYFSHATLPILEILGDLGVTRIVFSGGEPLLFSSIIGLIRRASALRFETVLATNGTLIDNEVAKELEDAGISFAQVSLDGDEMTHDALRGAGNFRKALGGIECLTRAKIDVVVRFTATRWNISSLPLLVDICGSFGVAFDIGLLKPKGRGKLTNLPTPQDFFEVIDRLFGGINAQVVQSSRSCHPIKAYSAKCYPTEHRCLAGTDLAAITHTGKFIPCPYISADQSLSVADHEYMIPVFDSTAKDIWINDPLFLLFRNSECLDCPISALEFSGDFNGVDPYGANAYQQWKREGETPRQKH